MMTPNKIVAPHAGKNDNPLIVRLKYLIWLYYCEFGIELQRRSEHK